MRVNKDCLFVCNGPSLDLNKIRKKTKVDIFVCNDFFLVDEAKNINILAYFNFDVSDLWIEKIKIYLKTCQPRFFIFSIHSKDKIEKSNFYKHFPKKRVFYLLGLFETKCDRFFLDITKPTFNIKNVILGYMLFANYMKYSNAFLHGADFSFLTVKKKRDLPHAYDINKSAANVTSITTYGQMCKSVSVVLKYIRLLDNHCETNFINSTPDSFIDILPLERR